MLNEPMRKALADPVVRPVVAAEIQWPDDYMRAHTGVGDLYLNTSKVWTPAYRHNGYIKIPDFKPTGDFDYSFSFVQNSFESWRSGSRIPNALYMGTQSQGNFTTGCGDVEGMTGYFTDLGKLYKCNLKYQSELNRFVVLLDGTQARVFNNVTVPGVFEMVLGATIPNYGYKLSGQLYDIKLVDHVDPENSRYYPSIIRSPSKPDTLILKDEWGDGSTDGELVGFSEGDVWEEAQGLIPGDTLFTGVGNIGSISAIKQSSGNSPGRLTLGLSAFDDSVRGEALRAKYQGRPVKVWLVALDEQHQLMATQMIWKGSIVDAKVSIGDSNQIEVVVSNRLEDWDKKRPDRFTDESQQMRHSGDRIFRYVPIMAEWPIYWGSDKQATPLRDSL